MDKDSLDPTPDSTSSEHIQSEELAVALGNVGSDSDDDHADLGMLCDLLILSNLASIIVIIYPLVIISMPYACISDTLN